MGAIPRSRLALRNCVSFAPERRHRLRSRIPGEKLTSSSVVTWRADALEGRDSIYAASSVEAGLAGAVVQVDGAETAGETHRAQAGKTIHAIQTGGAVGTGAHQAVVHVGLATGPREASQASARQFSSVTTQILA